ncbi:MAG: hypothetical protein RID91_11395 [Azospirillaceae bacterium]
MITLPRIGPRRAATALALAAALALPVLAPAGLALAQDRPPVMDEVVLSLSVEQWVETDTARVVVAVNAALGGSTADSVRAEILAALDGVAEGAEWRFVRFDRSVDDSGLERWTARIEARLAEDRLGGLAESADAASRPGLAFTVAAVAFEPTRAEVEATRASLRQEIYARVGEELDRLEAAFPDRGFRVAHIDFDAGPGPVPMMARAQAGEVAMMDAAGAPGPIAVSDKLVIDARVVLSAVAPDTP